MVSNQNHQFKKRIFQKKSKVDAVTSNMDYFLSKADLLPNIFFEIDIQMTPNASHQHASPQFHISLLTRI